MVTTGAIGRVKLESNHHQQRTNIQFFYRCPSCCPTNSVRAMKAQFLTFVESKLETRKKQQSLLLQTVKLGLQAVFFHMVMTHKLVELFLASDDSPVQRLLLGIKVDKLGVQLLMLVL